MMAVKIPDLCASVPYYGGQPTAAEAEQIKTPIMAQYAGLDARVNEGWPAFEAILKKNKVEHTAYFYPGVNHGFHNNTTPRYDEAAATLSWTRTIDFFKEKLTDK
jgi:carboxymethylenebutenolidase